MRVIITPEGETQLAARGNWWRQNRPKAPDLFDHELEATLAHIADRPERFPTFRERNDRTIRRCLMPKTRCHLYFEVRGTPPEVWVLAASGGQRRRPPTFKLQETP